MVGSIHRNDSNRLLLALFGNYRLRAHSASRGEFFMEAGHTELVVVSVDGEGNSVQGLAAGRTIEALNMENSSTGPEQLIRDRLTTFGAFFEGFHVAIFTSRTVVDVVKRSSGQHSLTLFAGEAGDMINLIHSGAAGLIRSDLLAT